MQTNGILGIQRGKLAWGGGVCSRASGQRGGICRERERMRAIDAGNQKI